MFEHHGLGGSQRRMGGAPAEEAVQGSVAGARRAVRCAAEAGWRAEVAEWVAMGGGGERLGLPGAGLCRAVGAPAGVLARAPTSAGTPSHSPRAGAGGLGIAAAPRRRSSGGRRCAKGRRGRVGHGGRPHSSPRGGTPHQAAATQAPRGALALRVLLASRRHGPHVGWSSTARHRRKEAAARVHQGGLDLRR